MNRIKIPKQREREKKMKENTKTKIEKKQRERQGQNEDRPPTGLKNGRLEVEETWRKVVCEIEYGKKERRKLRMTKMK